MIWLGGTKGLVTPKIVPKADTLAHVVRKAISKPFNRKMALDFKMDPKSLRTTVKTDLKLSPLKRQDFIVLQQRKRADLYWKLLKSGTQKGEIVFFQTKSIHFGGKVQSTKRQSASPTLEGCF